VAYINIGRTDKRSEVQLLLFYLERYVWHRLALISQVLLFYLES
jgi:hypothetical protein